MTELEAYRLREGVVRDVFAELERAERKHGGGWPADPFVALAIITEELGETAQAILDARYDGAPAERIYEEAVQVAAMGLRFLFNFHAMELAPEREDACQPT